MQKEINTTGDLKELLNKFDDNILINFGTEGLGFTISSYMTDGFSLALLSGDLQEYLNENDYS